MKEFLLSILLMSTLSSGKATEAGKSLNFLDVYHELSSTPKDELITSGDIYNFKTSILKNCYQNRAPHTFKCDGVADQIEKLKILAKCRTPFETVINRNEFIREGVSNEKHRAGTISKFAISELGNLQYNYKTLEKHRNGPALALVSLLEEFNVDGIEDNIIIARAINAPRTAITMYTLLPLIDPTNPHKDPKVRSIITTKIAKACDTEDPRTLLQIEQFCSVEFKNILKKILKGEGIAPIVRVSTFEAWERISGKKLGEQKLGVNSYAGGDPKSGRTYPYKQGEGESHTKVLTE